MALALALGSGGCSFSYRLGSMFSKDKEAEAAAQTGTDSLTSRNGGPQAGGLPPESDLVFAKAAASEALTRRDKDVSVPWENPSTGARGTVIPIASAYAQDGSQCRRFLVSYVQESTEAWIEGEACRPPEGKWEVRNLKPWKRS